MFAGVNFASLNYANPSKIEVEYATGGLVSVGLFGKCSFDIQPITRRGDPDNSLRVAYYSISLRYELQQTDTNEVAGLTAAAMLNIKTGLKLTYDWGTITFARASFEIFTNFSYTVDNDQAGAFMQAVCEFSVAPSTIASVIAWT